MSSLKPFWAKALTVMCLLVVCAAVADAYSYWGRSGGRYYYGDRGGCCYYGPYWSQNRDCYTYYYYYRPTTYATNYSYHTAFYYPQNVGNIQGGYYYYKNQRTGNLWGRCRPGSDNYELLAESAQGPNLAAIPQNAFQPQGKMTPVPNMEPATPIIPPPQPSAPPAE